MVFNATFNNIVILVEENEEPGKNQRPFARHWQTLSHNVVSSTPCLSGIRTHDFSGDRHGKMNLSSFFIKGDILLL